MWQGQAESFWDRVSAWAKTHCAFKGRLADAESSFLAEVESHWVAQEDFSCDEWKMQVPKLLEGCQPCQAWLKATSVHQKRAREEHLALKSKT